MRGWVIAGTLAKYRIAAGIGLDAALEHLHTEAIQTTEGNRGEHLKAVDKRTLKKSYAEEREGLTGYLGNTVEYYTPVHFGTAEGKPGMTRPRPILTAVNDANVKEVTRIIQTAIATI